jgi:hypothetical protein
VSKTDTQDSILFLCSHVDAFNYFDRIFLKKMQLEVHSPVGARNQPMKLKLNSHCERHRTFGRHMSILREAY